MSSPLSIFFFFFFNDTATTEIYTLSLHDALPILCRAASSAPIRAGMLKLFCAVSGVSTKPGLMMDTPRPRSEEHTSELQSQSNLVCRLLLEKKKKKQKRETRAQANTAEVSQRDIS